MREFREELACNPTGLAIAEAVANVCSMDTIPLSKAERELADLIHRASAGETIVVEAPTGERVQLAPLPDESGDRVPGLLKDKFEIPARLFEPLTEEELKLFSGEEP